MICDLFDNAEVRPRMGAKWNICTEHSPARKNGPSVLKDSRVTLF